jgi:hypothetical protein
LVDVEIINGILELRVRGLHKLWAFRDSVEIPLASIEVVRIDAARARAGPEGARNPGTSIPGVINLFAGIDDRYDEFIVEVADPGETVERINDALLRAK